MTDAAVAINRTQRDVVAWSTRLYQGFQRLRRRSSTEQAVIERHQKIQIDSAPFDHNFYWRWMAPGEEPCYVTPSRVKELLTVRDAIYAVCGGGEMYKLYLSDDAARMFVEWETLLRLHEPTSSTASASISPSSSAYNNYNSFGVSSSPSFAADLNNTAASLTNNGDQLLMNSSTPHHHHPTMNKSGRHSIAFDNHMLASSSPRTPPPSSLTFDVNSPAKHRYSLATSPTSPSASNLCNINHAAFNALTKTFYFSVSLDGIFYARLSSVEANVEAGRRVTTLKPLVTRQNHPTLMSFNGLAVDAAKCLLFCCCEDSVTVWSTYQQHQPVLLLQISLPHFAAANPPVQAMPYKCALLPDPRCNARACLVVCDKRNSEIVTFSLQYYTPILPGPAMSAAVTKVTPLAVAGSKIGHVQRPQGFCFDPAGNLILADNGNQRIQFFVRTPTGVHDDDHAMAADDTIALRLGIFEQLKTVALTRTPSGQPVVLAGLGKLFGSTASGGKIVCVRCQTPVRLMTPP